MLDNPFYAFGMRVVQHPMLSARPKRVLSEDVMVSEEFRKDFNAWLLDFFGSREELYILGNDTLVCSPKTLARIRNFS